MNDTRTTSILQRVPAILAVTANSYGLNFQPGERKPQAAGQRRNGQNKSGDKPGAQR